MSKSSQKNYTNPNLIVVNINYFNYSMTKYKAILPVSIDENNHHATTLS